MKSFESTRFGAIEVEPDKVISFTKGLPGFPECCEFIVMDHDKDTPLKWLQCIELPEVAFLIVDPAQVLASYDLEIPAAVLAELAWDESRDQPQDVAIFVIMTLDGAELSANLRAPVVVHTKSRRAYQLILDDANLPLRHPIRPEPERSE